MRSRAKCTGPHLCHWGEGGGPETASRARFVACLAEPPSKWAKSPHFAQGCEESAPILRLARGGGCGARVHLGAGMGTGADGAGEPGIARFASNTGWNIGLKSAWCDVLLSFPQATGRI